MFVIVRASGKHQHRHAGENPGDDVAGMAGHAAYRKARQFGVGNSHRVSTSSTSPPRPEPSTIATFGAPSEPLDQHIYRFAHFRISP